MSWLNYHHLLYFWATAKHGTITAATSELHVTPQTVSTQIKALEQAVGEQLFHRRGRRLELTELGKLVYGYADEIFSLGQELSEVLRGAPARGVVLHVGVTDALSKVIVHHVLEPVDDLEHPVRVVCQTGKPERLLADLMTHELDVLITDAPVPPALRVGVYNHLLGRCGVAFVAAPALAKRLKRGFPRSLHEAPFLVPTSQTTLRASLERWFHKHEVQPQIVGEFADSGVLKVYAQRGRGVIAVPTVVEAEIRRAYRLSRVGMAPELEERFYAISAERRVRHPAVVAICAAARDTLFG
jgi:LysR family transcriptional activator of nhaA